MLHICGRRQVPLDEAAASISAATGGVIQARVCDIRNADAVDAIIEAIWQSAIAPTKDLSARGFRAITSREMFKGKLVRKT